LLPEVGEGLRRPFRQVRAVRAVWERDEDLERVAGVALGHPLAVKQVDLPDGARVPSDPELAVDGDEGAGEDEPAHRRPEPLRPWTDERHAVGVDECHVRSSAALATDWPTIGSVGWGHKGQW